MFNSCKKGPQDPFISLRSREARLKGEWNLTSGNVTITIDTITTTKTFTASMVTVTTMGQTSTFTHTEKYEFLKYNIFKSTKMNDSNVETGEGYWAFMDGYADVANKVCVAIKLSSHAISGQITNYTDDNMPVNVFKIVSLSSNELIIETNGTTTGTSSDTINSTKTYTKK